MSLFERMMKAADRVTAGMKPDADALDGAVSAPEADAASISPCERDLARALAQAAQTGAAPVRYDLLFSGDVQGVGFRWTNQGLAREHHLTGWVRNLDDGTVAMEIQGAPAAVSEHLARIHAYYRRFHNRILLESARALEPLADEKDFDVRY